MNSPPYLGHIYIGMKYSPQGTNNNHHSYIYSRSGWLERMLDHLSICHNVPELDWNRPDATSIGTIPAQFWQHWADFGPVLAHYGIFTGLSQARSGMVYHVFRDQLKYTCHSTMDADWDYCQISNIRCTFIGSKIVDQTDVVGASSVGTTPTTSSFSA